MILRVFLLFSCSILFSDSFAQTLPAALAAAVKKLEADPQMKHALLGFHVVESATGNTVFTRNTETGLAVASSQKVFTAAAAFDLLGPRYSYTTELWLSDTVGANGVTQSTLIVSGSGDPTLGSWRYKSTTDSVILNKWVAALKAKGITQINGGIQLRDQNSASSLASPIPEGYIWQDIGNYYGAGSSLTNWHENQYDIIFRSGATGSTPLIVNVTPDPMMSIVNLVRAGKAGSGDNAYVFAGPYSKTAYVKGTIPPNSNRFSISGSFPDPALALGNALWNMLVKNGIRIDSNIRTSATSRLNPGKRSGMQVPGSAHESPAIDSIIYWFLKKSINLYGEAILKTLSMQVTGAYELESGVELLKSFWERNGIEPSALNVSDGSGLSPSNRVTVASLVKVMQYAKTRPWFNSFYDALPEYNGIKMKSGTINGVKSFTGYVKSRSNKEYTFAIVVNNYNGSAAQAVQKMYSILNILK